MRKILIKFLLILIGGAIGGIIAQIFIIPALASNNYFQKFSFIKQLREKTIIVNPKEEIFIQENIALTKAVEQVDNLVAAVYSSSKSGKEISGSGLAIASDGLIVTLSSLVPQNYQTTVFLDGQNFVPQIIKRDPKQNLVLLKIGKENLSAPLFADFDKIKLGEKVFLSARVLENNAVSQSGAVKTPPAEFFKKIVEDGIIKSLDENFIKTSISDKTAVNGSPLFDIEGKVLGLNIADKEGGISSVPVKTIKLFAGF